MSTTDQETLSLYLQAYNKVPKSEAKTAKLETSTNDDIVITTKTNRYTIPRTTKEEEGKPTKLTDLELKEEALKKLGYSTIKIDKYEPPKGIFPSLVFSICLFTFLGFYKRSNFLPGSFVYDFISSSSSSSSSSSPDSPIAKFIRFCYTIQPILFPSLVVIHGLEAGLFVFKRLARFHVPRYSLVWVAWVIDIFIEGVGGWKRFDDIVKDFEKKEKKI